MPSIFVIEDEIHAERQGEYTTFEEAVTELKRRMKIPWDQEPNVCPCKSWRSCERCYKIIEYDASDKPWKEVGRKAVLDISSKGIKWYLK